MNTSRKTGEKVYDDAEKKISAKRKKASEAYEESEAMPIGTGQENERLYELLDALEAVRQGNLGVKLRAGQGIYGKLANSFNVMVDNLNNVADSLFIDRNWPTEHYAGPGRKIIAKNLADSLKSIYPKNYIGIISE